jgi:hypothetical protein
MPKAPASSGLSELAHRKGFVIERVVGGYLLRGPAGRFMTRPDGTALFSEHEAASHLSSRPDIELNDPDDPEEEKMR